MSVNSVLIQLLVWTMQLVKNVLMTLAPRQEHRNVVVMPAISTTSSTAINLVHPAQSLRIIQIYVHVCQIFTEQAAMVPLIQAQMRTLSNILSIIWWMYGISLIVHMPACTRGSRLSDQLCASSVSAIYVKVWLEPSPFRSQPACFRRDWPNKT